MADDKRCMTQLDAETMRALNELRDKESRSESQMIAILVKEALALRQRARV